jgi:phosphoribosylanthranilate isomerase
MDDRKALEQSQVEIVHVKICGVRTLEEALFSCETGADLLGFNFYPSSPRFIPPLACARLLGSLANRQIAIRTVGVFVNEAVERVTGILDDCGLDLAQLHGDEPPDDLTALDGRSFKALRLRDPETAVQEARRYARPGLRPALLVDANFAGQYGGTGRAGDWSLARALADHFPVLLAGGLNPGNVAAAIRQVRPWGVDVASGVESAPGRKDRQKIAAFIKAVGDLSQEVTLC